MADYLKKPSIRKSVNVVRGDRLREGQSVEMHLTQPLASNIDVPEKNADLLKVEVPDDKILAAKEKKKEQAARTGFQKPPVGAGGKSTASTKRSGEDVSSRVQKKSRTAADSPVIHLDSSESIFNPTPIRSLPPQGQSSVGGEGSSGQKGSVEAGKLFRSFFSPNVILLLVFILCICFSCY